MNEQTIKTVILADDHPIFRAGLKQIFEDRPGYRVVAEVADGLAALTQIEILRPEFAVFDLNMPKMNGFDALKQIRKSGFPTQVLIVSMHAEAAYAKRAGDLGAIGFIAKEDAPTEVIKALDEAHSGFFMSQSVGSPQVSESIHFDEPADDIDLAHITRGERKVLLLLSLGKTSKEIAVELGISPRTVQAHRRNIAEKLGVTGPNRLLELAVRYRDKIAE